MKRIALAFFAFAGFSLLIVGLRDLRQDNPQPNPDPGPTPPPTPVVVDGDLIDECIPVLRKTVAEVLRQSSNHSKEWFIKAHQQVLVDSFKPLSDRVAAARWDEANIESVAKQIERGEL